MNYFLQNQASMPSHSAWSDFMVYPATFPMNIDTLVLSGHSQLPRSEQSCSRVKKEKRALSGKGKWTNEEQLAYIQFIEDNLAEMETKLMRKSRKVFLNMSKLVKTRTADQCRSHHQKILIYHQSLEEIVRFYRQNPALLELEKESNGLMKKQARTNVDDSRESSPASGSAVRVQCHRNHIRIVIEDCLISAFNFC